MLAELVPALDHRWGEATDTPVTLSINSNAATWLLSTLAGAMITTLGVVFSLTVVSLQLASSQFSPRVMRSFIRERLSQVVIGLLVATFVYCAVTLREMDSDPAAPAPALTLTVAVVLSVVTVILNTIIAAVARRSSSEEPWEEEPPHDPDGDDTLVVPARRGGWLTQASSEEMFAVIPPDSTLRFETRTHSGRGSTTPIPPSRSCSASAACCAGS